MEHLLRGAPSRTISGTPAGGTGPVWTITTSGSVYGICRATNHSPSCGIAVSLAKRAVTMLKIGTAGRGRPGRARETTIATPLEPTAHHNAWSNARADFPRVPLARPWNPCTSRAGTCLLSAAGLKLALSTGPLRVLRARKTRPRRRGHLGPPLHQTPHHYGPVG